MKILVTGANGFIGKNLVFRLQEYDDFELSTLTRDDSDNNWRDKLSEADAVIHLAGENRPPSVEKFKEGMKI